VRSCCEKWMLWPINDVQALWGYDFINWGHIYEHFDWGFARIYCIVTRKWCTICSSTTHIVTFAQERNMNASWNSKYRVWHSIYTFELIFYLYLSF
jgi:hypothetical protein